MDPLSQTLFPLLNEKLYLQRPILSYQENEVSKSLILAGKFSTLVTLVLHLCMPYPQRLAKDKSARQSWALGFKKFYNICQLKLPL